MTITYLSIVNSGAFLPDISTTGRRMYMIKRHERIPGSVKNNHDPQSTTLNYLMVSSTGRFNPNASGGMIGSGASDDSSSSPSNYNALIS